MKVLTTEIINKLLKEYEANIKKGVSKEQSQHCCVAYEPGNKNCSTGF